MIPYIQHVTFGPLRLKKGELNKKSVVKVSMHTVKLKNFIKIDWPL